MPVLNTTNDSVTLNVGDEWNIGVVVTDNDGYPTSATVSVAVTTPSGGSATPAAEEGLTGFYTISYVPVASGRHLMVVTVSGAAVGVAPFTAWADTPTAASGMPDLAAVKAYLGDTSWSDADITGALAAEAAAQRRKCDIPPVYPADLAEALKRRVARNLAARSVPVATFTSFDGGGVSSRVPQTDPEIVRLETPYRKWFVG